MLRSGLERGLDARKARRGLFPALHRRNARSGSRTHRGSKLVLYFYPKDNTPGCTLEGADFRDRHKEFRAPAARCSACRATRSSRTRTSRPR